MDFDGTFDGTFDGAKVALFLGDLLVIMRRDDDPRIPWPGFLDFPGGGREGSETPFQTVARETREELGLHLPEESVLWCTCDRHAERDVLLWFFVARLPADCVANIVFGDEGQYWRLAEVNDVLARPDVAGQLQRRLANWLAGEAACDVAPFGRLR